MSNSLFDISISQLFYHDKHPIKICKNEQYYTLLSSIKENGLLQNIVVQKDSKKGYEVVDGRLRVEVFKDLGIETIPCEIFQGNQDKAMLHLLDSNIRRENILPSELGFLLRERMEIMSRQGKRSDLTSVSDLRKLEKPKETRDILGELVGKSGVTVSKYIRLTYLNPELLELVNQNKLCLASGAYLSHLDIDAEQLWVLRIFKEKGLLPNEKQAREIKATVEKKKLTLKKLDEIMGVANIGKTQKIVFSYEDFTPYFEEDIPPEELKAEILKVISYWKNRKS